MFLQWEGYVNMNRNLVDSQMHQNDLPDLAETSYFYMDYAYRANGDIMCDFCKRPYKFHPYYLDSHDHQLCNGDVVHL
jgi:hypothetical protein